MIGFESKAIRDYVYSGVIHGIKAWTIYAIVECCFACILSWIIKPNYDYVPLHWGFTVLLFVLYTILGLIPGGLTGVCIHAIVRNVQLLQKTNLKILFPAMATSTV